MHGAGLHARTAVARIRGRHSHQTLSRAPSAVQRTVPAQDQSVWRAGGQQQPVWLGQAFELETDGRLTHAQLLGCTRHIATARHRHKSTQGLRVGVGGHICATYKAILPN